MAFLDLVRQRCSVRRYAAAPVSREVLDRCLEAARLAPSACNSQPWSFIVVEEAEARQRLAAAAFTGIYAMNAFAATAPVLIVAVTERSRFAAALGGRFRGVQYNLIDLGIACEHLVLQATEEGLGTCWLGWFNENAVKQILGLPSNTKVDIMISLGHPADVARPVKRKPLSEIRRFI